MAPHLTEAQMEIIEEMWRMRRAFNDGRINKSMVRSVAIRCWDVGPGLAEGVTAQLIGRYV